MKYSLGLCPVLVTIIFLTCAEPKGSQLSLPEISDRVVNGVEARDGQFPYVIWMTVYEGYLFRRASHNCDGTIISPNWILTAAHCILHSDSFLNIVSYDIRAGRVLQSEYTQFDRIYEEDAFAHPGYNDSTLDNDIALLKSHGFDINTETVQSVALAPREWANGDVSYLGKTFILAGFGYASDNGQRPRRLLWAKVPYVPRAECEGAYGGEIPETVICADDYEIPTHNSCRGDSGGPIVLKTPSGKVIEVGISSFGFRICSSGPGAYTNVAMFRDWIDSIMAEHSD
ncbi:Peptidase S1, PA clan [Sergentomyia squamirostris]